MKVKNIMFFGFAAAILSATGAQAAASATFSPAVSAPEAAGRQIVSSKSYVDSVATNIAGQLKSVAVTGDYNDLDNKPTVDTTFSASSNNAATSAAIATYVGDQITAAAPTIDSALSTTSENAVQNKVVTTELNKKANSADLATVATSGNYNDLTNKPTNVSTFTNDANYITASDVQGAQAQADWNETDSTAPSYIDNKPTLAAVATTGSYNSLTDTPTVDTTFNSSSTNAATSAAIATYVGDQITAAAPTIDSALSTTSENAVQNKVVTTELNKKANSADLATVATSGQYSDLAGTPTVDTTFDSGSSNAATSAAIATYIDSQNFTTVDSVIPAKPDFCTDANPCALLQDANGYNWYSMATDQSTTRQAGTDEKPNPRS